MKKVLQIVGLVFGLGLTFFILTGCEQPAPEAEGSLEVEAEAEAPEGNAGEGVTSIDADGNIAPFGFASKQPVPVPEPASVAIVATSAASSDIYNIHCIACHGADAQGVEGLGLSLADSQLVASSSEAELSAFLKVGRLPDSPDSVTGVPMPAFAWMSDAELTDVTGYLKSLNK
jgi:mono/diheme cytochrome c family protein